MIARSAGSLMLLAGLAAVANVELRTSSAADDAASPYVDKIVKFEPGPGAGFGADKQPEIVLGPPRGAGKLAPSRHVLSLGTGGTITLEFVDN
ncbi:MAG: cell surface protein, partial [Planctomycetaceae bacterium]